MTTLANLQTTLATTLRDSALSTFTSSELNDWINRGIDAVSDVNPNEATDYSIAIAANVYTYVPTQAFSRVYRVDIHTSADSYIGVLPKGIGEGRDSGWEWHAGILWVPQSRPITTGYKLRLFGYARYVQLAANTSTTDMDQSTINAVMAFAEAEAMFALMADRAKFQEWQATPGNSDVSLIQVASIQARAEQRWRREQSRVRRMRKNG